MLCLLRALKNLFSLAQETTADHQPLAQHCSVALGSTGGAEPPQSHHPGLPLTHEEELQAPGCLSKPRGSTRKHQHPSKHSQKPSSIPRVGVSPGAGAAQQVGLCTSSLLGCSSPARPHTMDRQGSPGEGPHVSPPWDSTGRGLPGSGEGGDIPCNCPTMSNLEQGALFWCKTWRGLLSTSVFHELLPTCSKSCEEARVKPHRCHVLGGWRGHPHPGGGQPWLGCAMAIAR